MKSVLAAVFVVLAAAPAVADEAAPKTAPSKPTKPRAACFYAQSASNFAVADDHTVHVRAGLKTVYELKLFSPCLDLTWTHSLGLVSRSSSMICEGPLAGVEVVTRGGGLGPQRCQVSNVRKLTPEEAQALPSKARP